jgi:ABC-2 type transport system ATP-binding protein
VLEKPIGKLSKGYRQRVGLAQALLHDPEVLIMDEPTAGLDPNQIREFRRNLKELGRTKTVLISTHILREVEATADRVLLIHSGRLIYDGTPEALREEGSLEEPVYRLTDYGRPPGWQSEVSEAEPDAQPIEEAIVKGEGQGDED